MVTGGTGFVGINVARELLLSGEAVLLLHRSPAGPMAQRYLAGLAAEVRYARVDVTDREALVRVVSPEGIDWIVHAAAVTANTPSLEMESFMHTVDVNIAATLHVLELARAVGARRILHISSASIYPQGGEMGRQLVEETIPRPQGLYAITKYTGELLAIRYAELYGIDLRIARVSSPYGPMERKTGSRSIMSVPYQVVHAALRGEEILAGPELVARDWTYVKDTARALVFLLRSDRLHHQIYNVSCGKAHTLMELLLAVRSSFPDTKWRIVDDPDARRTVAAGASKSRAPLNVTRLVDDEGFRLRFSLQEGVSAYVEWCRNEVRQGVLGS